MSGKAAQKMLEKMRASPNGWGQKDFETLLCGFGFEVGGTKHAIYMHPLFHELVISIPRHNDVKPVYARDAVKLIDELEEKMKELEKQKKRKQKMEAIKKDLKYYLKLPYTLRTELIIEEDKKQYWVAEYSELRGCKADGATEAEAVKNLQDLFDEYITTHLEKGYDIPEPAPLLEFGEDQTVQVVAPKTTIRIKWIKTETRKSKIPLAIRNRAKISVNTENEVPYIIEEPVQSFSR